MDLGIIPLEEKIELIQLRLFRQGVRMGDEADTKMAWQARTQGRDPSKDPDGVRKKGYRRF